MVQVCVGAVPGPSCRTTYMMCGYILLLNLLLHTCIALKSLRKYNYIFSYAHVHKYDHFSAAHKIFVNQSSPNVEMVLKLLKGN